MKRNIARIKVDNKSLLKISCSGDKDYIFSIPRIEMDVCYCEAHFTFHTQNNRITFKITDFGTPETPFDNFKEEARTKGFHVTKDIDIYKNKLIDNSVLQNALNSLFNFELYGVRDDFIKKSFCETKTPDSAFPRIYQLNPNMKLNSVGINVLISKNLVGNPINMLKRHKSVFDEVFMIHNELKNDCFMFTVLVRYFNKPMKKLHETSHNNML